MQDLKGAVSLRMTELKEGEIIEVGHEMVTKALANGPWVLRPIDFREKWKMKKWILYF